MRLFTWFCLVFILIPAFAATPASWQNQSNVQDFITMMVNQYQFSRTELVQLFQGIDLNQQALDIMNRPGRPGAKPTPWGTYQKRAITPAVIKQGKVFKQDHQTQLSQASQRYQVDTDLLVATLGIETQYGTVTGNFPTLDTLATLAFSFPPRAAFFQSELKAFLLLTRDHGIDPTCVQGSYAGAIGAGQFMPSSLRQYSTTLPSKSNCQSLISADQAIMDIANYYHVHGWINGAVVAEPARIVGQAYLKLPEQSHKPKLTLAQLAQYGIYPTTSLPAKTKASFFVLNGQNGPEYWLTFHDFYVITRYNASVNYAMAVYQLSQQIQS